MKDVVKGFGFLRNRVSGKSRCLLGDLSFTPLPNTVSSYEQFCAIYQVDKGRVTKSLLSSSNVSPGEDPSSAECSSSSESRMSVLAVHQHLNKPGRGVSFFHTVFKEATKVEDPIRLGTTSLELLHPPSVYPQCPKKPGGDNTTFFQHHPSLCGLCTP